MQFITETHSNIVPPEKPEVLLEEIRHLVKSPRARADMADKLAEEARSDAAKRLADLILEEALIEKTR